MIHEFLSSWSLFQNTYLVGWVIAVTLALNGFLLVSRNQIFYGAAVAQSSTLGVALGFLLSESSILASVLAILFSILAAFFMMRKESNGKISHEAITGWVFLTGASLSILVVSHSPHGLEEVHRLQASSIIGATRVDLLIFGVMLIITLSLIFKFGQKLLLFAMDHEMANAVGMTIKRWSFWSSIWLGLVIGLSIRTTGMLYTFGCLVLPGLAAKSLSKELGQFFFKAPTIALLFSFLGFLVANYYDFPPAQMTIAWLAFFFGMIHICWKIVVNFGRKKRGKL